MKGSIKRIYNLVVRGFKVDNTNNALTNPRGEALKVTVNYGMLGAIWVFLSDLILDLVVEDPAMYRSFQTYKGWAYVALTMVMIYVLIKNRMELLSQAIKKINHSYEELSITHEKLIFTEEELRHQYDELEKSRDALLTSNQRFGLVVEGSNDGIWEWDAKNKVYSFSIKNKILGYSPGEIEDSHDAWRELLHPDDVAVAANLVERFRFLKNGVYENTYRLRCKDGSYRWILSKGKAIYDKNGEIIRIGGSHTDITDQINLLASLRREVTLSENVLNNVSVIIAVWDNKGRILRFNTFAEKTFGYTEKEVLGKSLLDVFVSGEKREALYTAFQRIKAGEHISNYESQFLRKDGKSVDILWNSSILYKEDDQILEMISVGTDITERKEMEKRLYSLAYIDSLTGLSNRVMFEDQIQKLIELRCEDNNRFALVYMDIDNFKHINDTLGHYAGDILLKHVSEVLKSNVSNRKQIFRLGGDEFAIIIDKIQGREYLIGKIDDLIDKLRKPWIYENQEFFLSFSIGIVIYPEHGMDFMTLFKNVDTAMYSAKEKGKDSYCFYSKEMQGKTIEYIQTINQLRYAIEKEEFILYYQPQVDLNTGKITAVEALIRWNHPEKGLVPPLEFIPLAESTGLIHPITDWVIKTACEQMKEWERKGYPNIKMSINFSGNCFNKINLIEEFKSIVNSMGMDYNQIQIEITETAFMSDLQLVIDIVRQFRDLGVKVALDDFGTGYSSLTYLRKLPIDTLKIDRGFINNIINKNNEAEEIVKTIIQLAKALNISVVAEGIETKEQLMFLKENGCNEVQGYYFSKPIPKEEVEKLFLDQYIVDKSIEEIDIYSEREA